MKRSYCISCDTVDTVRAWQGHQSESKYFTVLAGSFEIYLIAIDNWDLPSTSLKIDRVILRSEKYQTLVVPGGYATGIRNIENDSLLLVFSNVTLEQSIKDDYRYDKEYWNIW